MMKLNKWTFAALVVQPLLLFAIPVSPNVTQGGAAITGQNSTNLGVNVTSGTNIIEWDSFDIAAGEAVTFSRQGSAGEYSVWNNVTGTGVTQIDGSITATRGNIYLYNDSGVVIGSNGVVLAKSFTITTLDKVGDFTPGSNMTFTDTSSTSTVNVQGQITSSGGDVTIIGYRVINSGTVTASDTVAVAAGRSVLLQPGTNQRVTIVSATSSGTGNGIINQVGATLKGQSVVLVADGNAYALAVNQQGIINSTACTSSEGRVTLIADPKTNNKGAVTMSGSIVRNSSAGDGSPVTIIGDTVALTGSASINMSGANGGGNIVIGDQATYDTDHIHIASGASITSNGSTSGSGGNVTMWANDSIVQIGPITSMGAGAGNGGAVSLASPGYLGYNATTDLRGGTTGSAGTLTLTTSTTNVGGTANYGSFFGPTAFTHGSITSTATTTGLQATLALSNVSIVADGTNVTGNMKGAADLTWSSGRTLTLNAVATMQLNNDLTMTGSSSSGTTIVSLTAPTVNIGSTAKTHTSSAGVSLTSGNIVSSASTALNINGGAGANSFGRLNTSDGTNTIAFGTSMNVVGGDATGANAEVTGTTVTINGLTAATGDLLIQADDCTKAFIDGTTINFGQTTEFADLELIGGKCSTGSDAYIGSLTGESTIDIDIAGNLLMTGGSTGTSNHARILSSGGTNSNVAVNANSITINGGTGGTGNTSHIASLGSLGTVNLVTVQDMTLSGGTSSATGASSYVEATVATLLIGRDLTLNGGAGTLAHATIEGYAGIDTRVARNLAANGGTASLAQAQFAASSGDILIDSSTGASTFTFSGGRIGATNAPARVYMSGNGNIKVGSRNAPNYLTLTGGANGVDVYAQFLVEGDGNIDARADQDMGLYGGGSGTYTYAGMKTAGSGTISLVTGRDLLMTTGTSTSSDVYIHATNGSITGDHGRDVVLIGSCSIPNSAYIQSDTSAGGIIMDVVRNISQSGKTHINVTGETQLLTLNVGGEHTILDCSSNNGGSLVVVSTLPGNSYYSFAFLYELFYKLHYYTNYDFYLMHIQNFWDSMMRTSS